PALRVGLGHARYRLLPPAQRSINLRLWRAVAGQRFGYLGREIILALLDSLPDGETGKAPDGDVFANLRGLLGDQFLDLLLVVLNPGLVHQADGLAVLLQLAGDDLLPDRLGLFLLAQLLALNFALLLEDLGRDVLAPDVERVGGDDLHREVFDQPLKVLVAGDEVGLAVDLHQRAETAAMDVGANQTLGGDASLPALTPGDALLAKVFLPLGEIALRLGERLLAIHHPRPGLFPELLHHSGGDLSHLLLRLCHLARRLLAVNGDSFRGWRP